MDEQVGVADVVRFATELAAVAAAYVVAADAGGVIAGVAAAVAVIVVWGRWFAPRSAQRIGDRARHVAEVCLFGGLGVLLVTTGHTVFGAVLAVVGVGDTFAVRRVSEGRGGRRSSGG